MENNNLNDFLTKKVGVKEKTALAAKPVTVLGVLAEAIQGKKGSKNEGKEVGKKLVLICKHPDREETLKISEMKFLKGEVVKTSTIWINLDDAGDIQKGSMVALLLDHAKVETLKELEGKKLDTALDNLGYLCIKAF